MVVESAWRVAQYDVGSLVLAVREWPRLESGEIDRSRLPAPPDNLNQKRLRKNIVIG